MLIKPIQELVHPAAAERHPAADLVVLAETEAADGHLRLGDLSLLAGDLRQLVGRLLHAVLVLQRLADAHVDDDLLQARQAVDVLAAQLRRQLRAGFLSDTCLTTEP